MKTERKLVSADNQFDVWQNQGYLFILLIALGRMKYVQENWFICLFLRCG
jgi:hypothetical protein